jgi:hypothetical protein
MLCPNGAYLLVCHKFHAPCGTFGIGHANALIRRQLNKESILGAREAQNCMRNVVLVVVLVVRGQLASGFNRLFEQLGRTLGRVLINGAVGVAAGPTQHANVETRWRHKLSPRSYGCVDPDTRRLQTKCCAAQIGGDGPFPEIAAEMTPP